MPGAPRAVPDQARLSSMSQMQTQSCSQEREDSTAVSLQPAVSSPCQHHVPITRFQSRAQLHPVCPGLPEEHLAA